MKKLKLFLLTLMGAYALMALPTSSVDALSGSQFQAGRIIDDHIFFNGGGMDPSQIQAFLNAKVPTCNTWHARSTSPRDSGPPYTCMKDYRQDTWGIPADAYCNGFSGGNKSAAQIIHEVGQSCGINQKVILITLQKEQSLVTDDWPWTSQYTKATGFGCPDTALPADVDANQNGCYDDYEGFFKQVYYGARQFKRYAQDANIFTSYRPYRTSFVRYNPNANCGGTNLYISNQATSGLYIYTPYQPNAAALDNLYGTGDGCSAYGNRNFWRMYNDWFNFQETLYNGLTVAINAQPDNTPFKGQSVTYTFTFTNRLSVALAIDAIGAVGRAGSVTGANRDLGWQGPVTFQSGETKQFTFTTTIVDTGMIYAWPAVNYQGTYVQYNNWGTSMSSRNPSTSLTTPLTSSVSNPVAGQDVTFSAVLKNNEAEPLNYDAIGIPVKFYDRYSYDAVWVGPGLVAPGADLTLSGTRNIDKPGPYTYWVSSYIGGTYSTIGSVKKLTSSEVSPNFSVSSISFSNAPPALGSNIGASFTVTNNLPVPINIDGIGVIGRFGTFSGPNRDIGWQGPVRFNAGETKIFTGFSRSITEVGAHYYWIGVLKGGQYTQYNNWGSTIVSLAPNFSVSGLSFNTNSPALGQNLETAFTVKNNLPVPIEVDGVGVVGRFGAINGPNRDLSWQGPVTFSAGETKSFTGYSRTITDVGNHYYWIGVFDGGRYLQYNNWGSTIVSHP
jgi:hypothetical protein